MNTGKIANITCFNPVRFARASGGLYSQWSVDSPVITIRVPVKYSALPAKTQIRSVFSSKYLYSYLVLASGYFSVNILHVKCVKPWNTYKCLMFCKVQCLFSCGIRFQTYYLRNLSYQTNCVLKLYILLELLLMWGHVHSCFLFQLFLVWKNRSTHSYHQYWLPSLCSPYNRLPLSPAPLSSPPEKMARCHCKEGILKQETRKCSRK